MRRVRLEVTRKVRPTGRDTPKSHIITLPEDRHLAVAVFVSDSAADDATRESVIARIAKAAWDWASVASSRRDR